MATVKTSQPHPAGVFGTGLLEGQGGAFRPSAFHVRADVLKTGTRLRDRKPHVTDKAFRHGNAEHLLRSALNYAREKGFKLEHARLRNDEDMSAILKEISGKGGQDIKLIQDDDTGEMYMETYTQANDDYTVYTIPIGPSYRMRKETGELVRRFVRAFAGALHIEDIMNTPRFDYETEVFDDQMNEQEMEYNRTKDENDKPENFFDNDWIAFHRDYKEDGEPYGRLMEYRHVKPLTEDELAAYKPETEAERRLVEYFELGFEYMNTGIVLDEHRDTLYMSASEIEEFQSNGFIDWDDLMFVCYESDDMVDQILDNLNADLQSGAATENIVYGGRLPEEGPLVFNEVIVDIIKYIDGLSAILEDKDLAEKKEKTTQAA